MLTDINFEVANTQQDILGNRRSLKNFNTIKGINFIKQESLNYDLVRKFSSSLRSGKSFISIPPTKTKKIKRRNSLKNGN